MQSSQLNKNKSNLPPVSKDNKILIFLKTLLTLILFPLKFIIIWFEGGSNQSSSAKHSSFVTKLKISLISLSIAMLMGLIIWPLTEIGQEQHKVSLERVDANNTDSKIVMEKPRFYGIDSNNQPYNIIAMEAKQQSENVIILSNVTGNMMLKDGMRVSMKAKTGTYNLLDKNVELVGNVNIITDNGYKFDTNTVHVDVETNIIKGDEKVKIIGLLGVLSSNSFIIKNNIDEMNFYGDVHLVAYPAQKKISVEKSRKLSGEIIRGR